MPTDTTLSGQPPTSAQFRAWLTRLSELDGDGRRELAAPEGMEAARIRAFVEHWVFRASEWADASAAAAELVRRGRESGKAEALAEVNDGGAFDDLVESVRSLARGEDLGGGILEMMARRLLDAARDTDGEGT